MKEFTNWYDCKGQEINEGDILQNPMMEDLWIVEKKDDVFYACLVPSSGLIKHPDDTEYPAYEEELEFIANVFEKVGNKYDNKDLIGR